MRIFIISLSFLLTYNSQAFSDALKEDGYPSSLTGRLLMARLIYSEPFHPLRGNKFKSLEEEFKAWSRFGKRTNIPPKALIFLSCKDYFSDPENQSSQVLELVTACKSWGWPPRKDSSLWGYYSK